MIEKFQLSGVSYSGSDIQDYFDYIIKKHESVSHNPSEGIYVKKKEKKRKIESYLKLKLGFITNFLDLKPLIISQ